VPEVGRQGDLPPASPKGDPAVDDPAGHRSAAATCEVAEGLTSWSVSGDGERVRLGFEDGVGRLRRLDLPFDAVSALLLTIPRMLRAALQVRGDPSARVVQPLGAWNLERAAGSGCLILTLSAPGGFDVAFAVAPDQLAAMGEAVGSADVPQGTFN